MLKIISGGQTGVDRAALDAGLERGLPIGGWCPKARRAEDGTVPSHYPLQETSSSAYEERTERNVLEGDGTLVLCRGHPSGGTALTISLALQHQRPLLTIDLGAGSSPEVVREWIRTNEIRVLNVAGPRESVAPGIRGEALVFLRSALELVLSRP